jgi:hypothetical protein
MPRNPDRHRDTIVVGHGKGAADSRPGLYFGCRPCRDHRYTLGSGKFLFSSRGRAVLGAAVEEN